MGSGHAESCNWDHLGGKIEGKVVGEGEDDVVHVDDQNTVFDKSIVKEQKIFAKKSTVKHKVDSSIKEDISNKSDDSG